MLENLREIQKPETVSEAIKVLNRGKGENVILAGGTHLMLKGSKKIKGLVDISSLNLNYIRKNKNSLKIGAGTTIGELLNSRVIKNYNKEILYKSSKNLASTPLRNLVTVGGNIVNLQPWSDLPVVLLVCDASVVIQGMKRKTMRVVDFFRRHPLIHLKYNEIVTEISFPLRTGKTIAGFMKFSRTKFDYTLLNIAVLLRFKNGRIENPRVAVSGATALPLRVAEVEKVLSGERLSEGLIDEAVEILRKSVRIVEDFRTTKEYKRKILGVLFKRIINEQRAEG